MRSSNYSIDEYKNKRIAVISGGVSSEREVSLKSGKNVFNALKGMGLNVIELDPSTSKFFEVSFDIAFNCLHGKWGEDGGLQGYCELMNIPYTGPGIKATAMGLNKPIFKSVLQQLGIPVPKQLKHPETFPCMSKPAEEGSSIGVSLIKSKNEWDEEVKKRPEILSKDYFIEEYIDGKEVTSGVIKINGDVVVLPILEIQTSHDFYDFEVKYSSGKTKYIVPANVNAETKQAIEDISKEIYHYFDCKGCIRIDMMIDENGPKVIEMNTNPGITEFSNIPAQAKAMGISFEELLVHYLNSAK